MNREIKFRAWDKENEEMYDVAMIDVETGEVAYTDHPTGYNADALLEQVELMQYTGLKDKNGKEIYEGDIVKIKHTYSWSKKQFDSRLTESEENEINSLVVFDAGRFRIKYPIILSQDLADFLAYDNKSGNICCCGKHIKRNDTYGHFSKTEDEFIEIIGNIYENPELLEVENE